MNGLCSAEESVAQSWKRSLLEALGFVFPLELRASGPASAVRRGSEFAASPGRPVRVPSAAGRPSPHTVLAPLPAHVGSVAAVSDPSCGSVGAKTRRLCVAGL